MMIAQDWNFTTVGQPGYNGRSIDILDVLEGQHT